MKVTPLGIKQQKYRRTVNGLISVLYMNHKAGSKRAGRQPPTYSKEQLSNWLMAQPNFKKLYDDWVASGYTKFLSPSVDRIDNLVGYDLNNIQLMTWKQNHEKQMRQTISGEFLNANTKPVRQLTKDGNTIVGEYPSISIALRDIKGTRVGWSHVADVANNKRKSAFGFQWEWV